MASQACAERIAPDLTGPSTVVDAALAMLREAMSETGWTYEALQAEMHRDKSYIHRVLNGREPMSLRFLLDLPDDLEARYEAKRVESFGAIVVAPLDDEAMAMKHLMSGLFGLFGPKRKPAKAGL